MNSHITVVPLLFTKTVVTTMKTIKYSYVIKYRITGRFDDDSDSLAVNAHGTVKRDVSRLKNVDALVDAFPTVVHRLRLAGNRRSLQFQLATVLKITK